MQSAYFTLFNQPPSIEYNWCSLVQSKINNVGFSYLWKYQSPTLALSVLSQIRERLISIAMQNDLSQIDNSTHFHTYAKMNRDGNPSFLLNLSIPLHLIRTFSQIRILGYPISVNNKFTLLSHSSICKFCLPNQLIENVFHILLICPTYANLRLKLDFININFPTHQPSFEKMFKYMPIQALYSFAKVLSAFFSERSNALTALNDCHKV